MNATNSTSRRSSGGFTLIELLTVIAIIGILAAIIIPTIGAVRKAAKETQSLSNLRQIALAINLYADDYKGKFPPGYTLIRGRETQWTTLMMPYIGNTNTVFTAQNGLFVSPLAEFPVVDGSVNGGSVPSTYSAHGGLLVSAENPENDTVNLISRSVVARPTQVILVGEATQRTTGTGYSNATMRYPDAFRRLGQTNSFDELIPTDTDIDGTSMGALRYRGKSGAPVAFVDGHVSSMRKGTVTYGNLIADR